MKAFALVRLLCSSPLSAQYYSYSEQFAFTPNSNDLELNTDGSVKLESMEMHEVQRTWD